MTVPSYFCSQMPLQFCPANSARYQRGRHDVREPGINSRSRMTWKFCQCQAVLTEVSRTFIISILRNRSQALRKKPPRQPRPPR